MLGVTIGEKHSFNDWGIILSSKIISPPEPQINKVNVPLRDGAIDLTESLTDDIKFKDRTITLNFTVTDRATWTAKISEIENYLHGKKMKIVFDDDLAFYYVGRVSVNKWATNKNIGSLVVEGTVEPFKYDAASSSVDWEWDIFDFENSIINETGELIVNGETTISLICRRKRMFPIFKASEPMTVKFDDETFHLAAGEQKLYGLFLCEGVNELTFNGNGTVSIDYIGGSL